MAGGTWITQTKARPGAYVNFKAAVETDTGIASRGVATMPLVMDWGPEEEVVEILSTDFADGNATAKIGYGISAAESVLFRECLKNCYKLLAYRVDSGGAKADATLGELTATALHPGTRGNALSVAVLAADTLFDIVTYLDDTEVDRQRVATIAALVDNDWVTFSGTGDLAATVATDLEGGTNGTSNLAAYQEYMELMKTYDWQVMGFPVEVSGLPAAAEAYIRVMRETLGKKVQAVVYNDAADYEGIISTKQGYSTATETISATQFVAWATGASAGASIAASNTYAEITDAIDIVNPLSDAEIEAALAQGFMVISRRTDGVIVIEQDINTLITFDDDKSEVWRKNRFIRTGDEIANSVTRLFENQFIGKISNNAAGRDLFRQALVKYLNTVQAADAIQNFDAAEITVAAGTDADSIIVSMAIQPVDSMEKLYMTVEVNG